MADFLNSYYKAGKKPRPDCKGQDNFSLGQVKNASLGSGGQVKLISVVLLVILISKPMADFLY